jgi:hypothetical protein
LLDLRRDQIVMAEFHDKRALAPGAQVHAPGASV